MAKRLYIGNLSFNTTPDSLKAHLESLGGKCTSVDIVSGGWVKTLSRNPDRIAERLGMRLSLKWVCDKDESRFKGLPAGKSLFSGDAQHVLGDPDVHVVIELIGGTSFAKQVILDALGRGKVVVTANKALLAHAGEEIFAVAAK